MQPPSREITDGGTAIRTGAPADGYRQVVESTSGYAIFVLSGEGRIDSWPDTARELYGYDAEEVLGEPFDRLWAKRDGSPETVEGLLHEAGDGPIETEQWHVCADGSAFWSTCALSPLTRGERHGYTVVSYDTTARKQYERMLERQNDRLKEFTDILSHDLRAPLSVVGGRLDLYRDTGDETHLSTIEATTDRMETLIEDLLRVARQGTVVQNPVPTDIGPLVRTAERGTIPATVTLRYDPVPRLMADGDRLCQLFENLFRNAVEHGGEDVVIHVGPMEDGFFVEDDGPGIPESIRPEVFDHGFTTHQEGSGFGLSVVRTIVGAHGWDVAATGSASGGARFEITGAGVLD
jgi:PAS domain S-box-containing protein